MPIHDGTRVPAGLFHHFHQDWSIEIARALNRGRLPKGLSALVEQRAVPHEADVLNIESRSRRDGSGNVAVMAPPTTRIVRRSSVEIFALRGNRVIIRRHLGRIVAVIEIVSPGNKSSRSALRDFVDKTLDCLRAGVHVLIVDLFPPTPRDPFGMHKALWDEIVEEDFTFPHGKDRILASYESGRAVRAAYVEPIAVGDSLPEMPLFLMSDFYIRVPLEPTYQATWDASPEELRTAVVTGVLPDPDAE